MSSALRVLAGPVARKQLRERGLRAEDVRLIPAAAGGAKGLILNRLDQALFGQWLPRSAQTIHLLGASIGAWRMAAACRAEPVAALQRLCEDYIHQDYPHPPGRAPLASVVSQIFGQTLHAHLTGVEAEVLGHPRFRLHVFASHGRGVLRREGRWRTPLGYGGAFAANLLSRRALGGWLERVVFSDAREPLPLHLGDFRSRVVPLSAANLQPAVLASCAIPFWLQAVSDIPGAPPGAYWDGGITDYHLHLRYDTLAEGLVLYPHFQASVIPGWLDKALRHRHRATEALDRVVLLLPKADWIARLPGAKLPDRTDFQHFGDDLAARAAAWTRAVAESQRLADEFLALAEQDSVAAEPL